MPSFRNDIFCQMLNIILSKIAYMGLMEENRNICLILQY
jgi:hypothetical protein